MKKKLAVIFIVLAALILGAVGIHYAVTPKVTLSTDNAVEVKSKYDPMDFVEKTHACKAEDLKVDKSKVNVKKLGTYEITYQYTKDNGKEYTFRTMVRVQDTEKPTVEGQDLVILVGTTMVPDNFITKVKDNTETTASFKEDYDFSKPGDFTVVINIKDEGGNTTTIKQKASVVKDTTAPELSGLSEITVKQGNIPDYTSGVSIQDDFDQAPGYKVDNSGVNINKVGTYTATYTATDASGNEKTYKRTVKVIENEDGTTSDKISSIPQSSSKIVYLTFDDGPSENTKSVLKVLNSYGIHATFFVTGNGQKYNSYIKDAYNAGNTIALHTYTHNYATVYASEKSYFSDLSKIDDMVYGLIGYHSHYIRFPGGSSNTVSKKYCPGIMSDLVVDVQKKGYQYYDWNCDSTDATGTNVAVDKLVSNATASSANNIIILMHDCTGKATTPQALPKIIEHYAKLGYCFRAIDDSSYTCHHGVNN